MMNVRDLKRAAREFGAIVENDSAGRWTVYQVIAPDGKVWVDGGCSSLRVEWLSYGRDGAIADAIARIKCGLDDY